MTLAGEIALLIDTDRAKAERAAGLAKCDLLSSMVGEVPELRGIMGRYYAAADGEPPMSPGDVSTIYRGARWPCRAQARRRRRAGRQTGTGRNFSSRSRAAPRIPSACGAGLRC